MTNTTAKRLVIAGILVAATALVLGWLLPDDDLPEELQDDLRMPMGNPPVEPDRPDLWEEPRPEKEPQP